MRALSHGGPSVRPIASDPTKRALPAYNQGTQRPRDFPATAPSLSLYGVGVSTLLRQVRKQAALGIGEAALTAAADACEEGGRWLE
eukprot:1992434-Prymnesium_polylepis.1